MATPNEAILHQLIAEIWNQGNMANLDTLVAESYIVASDPGDPWNGQTLDHETYKRRVAYTREAFAGVTFDIHESLVDDDRVAIRWTMSGTHSGDLPRLPATGRTFAVGGMTFYYFQDGKVAGHRQAFDQLGFLAQIGRLALGSDAARINSGASAGSKILSDSNPVFRPEQKNDLAVRGATSSAGNGSL